MTAPAFSVALEVGGHNWFVDQGDVPSMDQLSEGIPLDGMHVGWAYTDDGGLFPSQPQPVTFSLSVLFERAYNASGIALGASVAMELGTPAVTDNPTATFEGVIGALSVRPHEFGVVYSFTAVDCTAGLAELRVGDTPWPVEDIQARLLRIGSVITPAFEMFDPPVVGADAVLLAARDVDAQPALDLFTKYLRQWPARTTLDPDPHRIIVQAVPQPAAPIQLHLVELPDHITHGRYPGVLGAAGTISFTRAVLSGAGRLEPWVLEAGWLEFDAEWTQAKGTNVTRVEVSNDALGIVPASRNELPVVTAAVDGVELTDRSQMAELAAMYLPDTTGQAGWTVDKFRLLGSAPGVDLGSVPLIIGRLQSEFEPLTDQVLTGVVVIDNIPAEQTPAFQYPSGDAYYAGMLTGCELTVADGTWTAEFTLRPDIPPPPVAGDGDALTYNGVTAAYPALLIQDVDQPLTIADARLLRRF